MAGPARRLPEPAVRLTAMHGARSADAARLPLIDALKAIAAQLIVLHHLALYGPMADAAREIWPAAIDWLSQHARIAVQVFLVVGGFLAARSLAPEGRLAVPRPLAAAWRRYLKLAVPYVAALVLAIGGAALARQGMAHASIPDAPTLDQFLAHVLLLHDILGYDALSAGVWYVAIDFQLYLLLLALLWIARAVGGKTGLGPLMVACVGAASLFHFNRDAAGDIWATYFFGAYALGALAHWIPGRRHSRRWAWAAGTISVAALLVDFRVRIATTLLTALVLGLGRHTGLLATWPQSSVLSFLGRISYSVFLVHFPVCLLANALFNQVAPGNPLLNFIGMLGTWVVCVAIGAAFHRCVEQPAFFRGGAPNRATT